MTHGRCVRKEGMMAISCSDIVTYLEQKFPLKSAEEWDNPGLLIGRRNRSISVLVVSLDADDNAVAEAVEQGAELLITHHPLIFGSVKKINDESFLGRRILNLIEHGISCYAAHTNYDVRRLAGLNERQLGLLDTEALLVTREDDPPEGIGRVGMLPEPISYRTLADRVKTAMEIDSVRCYGQEDPIVRRVAVSGGAGRSVVHSALDKGAEVLITGDIDYHTGIDALAGGLRIIDAGHFGTEHCFIRDMAEDLRAHFPGLTVIEADQHPPFFVV